jgi:hypothetical protein
VKRSFLLAFVMSCSRLVLVCPVQNSSGYASQSSDNTGECNKQASVCGVVESNCQ